RRLERPARVAREGAIGVGLEPEVVGHGGQWQSDERKQRHGHTTIGSHVFSLASSRAGPTREHRRQCSASRGGRDVQHANPRSVVHTLFVLGRASWREAGLTPAAAAVGCWRIEAARSAAMTTGIGRVAQNASRRGFTLIELLVVIAIIAVLVAV